MRRPPRATPRRRRAAIALLATLAVAPAALAEDQAATPRVPGVVIAHSPASSRIYIGSAGIARLDDGAYLAKHDEFGPGSTEHVSAVTRVYRSRDRGETWQPIAKLDGLFWSNIFVHRGAVYMIGTHHHHGELVVRRSTDGGETWTDAVDGTTGLIRSGAWHTAPMPIVEHRGRLWRAVEDADGGDDWGVRYRPRMASIALDGDLLNADAWTLSNPVTRDGGWLGGVFRHVLEGNVTVDRDGVVRNILRSDRDELAAVATAADDGQTLRIDPAFDRAELPGSSKKMLIRWDEPSDRYWALTNPVGREVDAVKTSDVRNTLALFSSDDLRHWSLRCVLLHHPDWRRHGFQYPDWIVEGDDLLVASRTAYDDGAGGAERAHDANYLTFHRIRNFRRLTPADGPQVDLNLPRPDGR